LTVICPGKPWRPGAVARVMLLPLVAAMTLVACSSASNRGVTGNVGIGTGIALSTPGSVTQIQQATTIVVTASVTADVNNAGVTWSLSGDAVALGATLSDQTATTVTFNAPPSVLGAADATVTATSVVNPATAAAVTLIVLGKPQMNPVQLFPGNVNVPYAAPITVAGGLAEPQEGFEDLDLRPVEIGVEDGDAVGRTLRVLVPRGAGQQHDLVGDLRR